MIGNIILFTGQTIPEGYLVCNGSAISRDDYADLFDVIGTTYGSGDGSTTFNLPDLSGSVAIGVSSTHSIGVSGGEETHILITNEIPSHTHTVPAHGHGNDIAFKTPQLSHTVSTQPSYKYNAVSSLANRGRVGSGVNYISSTKSASMSRTNASITAHAATACTMSGGITDCGALTAGDSGTGGAHNNMMPYLALTYIIRATPETPPQPRMLVFNGCMPVTAQGYYLVGAKS